MEDMTNKLLKPIVLKTPLGFDYFDYDEIVMIEAKGNSSLVFTLETNSPVRTLHNLAFIEKKYCNRNLFRCHKSFIINLIHVENLYIKTHQVHLKKNLIVPLSVRCLRIIRHMSNNPQNLNNVRLLQKNPNHRIFNKMKIKFGIFKGIGIKFKKTIGRFRLMSIMTIALTLVISHCERNDRFYRPNMSEKLCSIGIIDADDTLLRHISFEKSFQVEYPEEGSLCYM